MGLRGFSLWNKTVGLAAQAAAHEKNKISAVYVSAHEDSRLRQRDVLIKSLRKGDGVGVLGLHCLATDKEDLRWALIGEDEATKYKGIFARGCYVHVYEIDAKITDMPTVEAVLSATEFWAGEGRKRSRAEDIRYGSLGGRPVAKRLPKSVARPLWLGPGTIPERLAAINALARERGVKGYTRSAAFRHLKSLSKHRPKPNGQAETEEL